MGPIATTYRIENDVPVPMRDGVRLAARVLIPNGPGRFPAVVNLMPYHKDGIYSVGYVDAMHRYLSERGYVTVTVDLRGTGASEGLVGDAFGFPERFDGYDLVEWAARQSWSTGAVGMWGLSYGGITALSTACVNPPSLRAIVPIHAATDMYGDYLQSHGCRTAFSPDVHWGIRMAASLALPPLSALDGVDAHAMWLQRLTAFHPWVVDWHDDADDAKAWEGRLTDVSAIRAATYVVGGWRDIFADVAVRTFNELKSPRKLLLGPWKHIFPDLAAVAPIGFSAQMQRWFDRWLKDALNGIDEEPAAAFYVYGSDEWRGSRAFPPSGTTVSEVHLLDSPLTYEYEPLVGVDTITMHWLAGPDTPQYPPSDDAFTIALDTPAFDRATRLTGIPSAVLNASASIDDPPVVARLFELHAGGERTFVTMGWQRRTLTGETEIAMRPIAYDVAAGSRLRLTLSCADISRIWPETKPFTLDVRSVTLRLPVIGSDASSPVAFEPPHIAASPHVTSNPSLLQVSRSALRPAVELETSLSQTYALENGSTIVAQLDAVLTVDGGEPANSTLHAEAGYVLRRADGEVRTRAILEETAGKIEVTLTVTDGGAQLLSKTFNAPVKKPLSLTQPGIERVAQRVSEKVKS